MYHLLVNHLHNNYLYKQLLEISRRTGLLYRQGMVVQLLELSNPKILLLFRGRWREHLGSRPCYRIYLTLTFLGHILDLFFRIQMVLT